MKIVQKKNHNRLQFPSEWTSLTRFFIFFISLLHPKTHSIVFWLLKKILFVHLEDSTVASTTIILPKRSSWIKWEILQLIFSDFGTLQCIDFFEWNEEKETIWTSFPITTIISPTHLIISSIQMNSDLQKGKHLCWKKTAEEVSESVDAQLSTTVHKADSFFVGLQIMQNLDDHISIMPNHDIRIIQVLIDQILFDLSIQHKEMQNSFRIWIFEYHDLPWSYSKTKWWKGLLSKSWQIEWSWIWSVLKRIMQTNFLQKINQELTDKQFNTCIISLMIPFLPIAFLDNLPLIITMFQKIFKRSLKIFKIQFPNLRMIERNTFGGQQVKRQ